MNANPAGDASAPKNKWTDRPRKIILKIGSAFKNAGSKASHAFQSITSDSLGKTIALFATIVLVAVAAFILAVILRIFSPQSQVTVSAFEIFTADQKSSSIGGKALGDLVVDNLHTILQRAESYSGSSYSSAKSIQPMPDMPHIPVETSYGIEIKGVSLDQLRATWDHIRYSEFQLSGDFLLGTGADEIMRIRYTSENRANSFEVHLSKIDPDSVEKAVSDLSLQLVEDIKPEVAARFLIGAAESCENCKQAVDQAIQFTRTWVKNDPRNAKAYYYLGRALTLSEHPHDALAFFDRAIRLDSRLDTAFVSEGFVLMGEGKIAEAEVPEKAALRIRQTPNPLVNLGVLAIRQGRYAEAEAYFRKALALDKGDIGAYLDLGHTLLHQSRFGEAAEAYRQAGDLRPGDRTALRGLVISLAKEGRAQEGLSACDEAAHLDPDAVEPLEYKGIVYLITKQSDDAIQAFKSVIARSNPLESHFQLGITYLVQGDLDSANAKLQEILFRYPNDVRVNHLLAKLLQAQGKVEESKLHADFVDRMNPGFKNDTLDDIELGSKFEDSVMSRSGLAPSSPSK